MDKSQIIFYGPETPLENQMKAIQPTQTEGWVTRSLTWGARTPISLSQIQLTALFHMKEPTNLYVTSLETKPSTKAKVFPLPLEIKATNRSRGFRINGTNYTITQF